MKIIPKINEMKIVPKLNEEEDYVHLKSDNGNYRDKIDGDITTTEPVEDTMAGTKSPTSDEIGNIETRNNYWWSRTVGARGNLNCSKIITKETLKEHYKEKWHSIFS